MSLEPGGVILLLSSGIIIAKQKGGSYTSYYDALFITIGICDMKGFMFRHCIDLISLMRVVWVRVVLLVQDSFYFFLSKDLKPLIL